MSNVVEDKIESWSMPDLGKDGDSFGPLTAGKIEEIQQAAYQEAWDAGHKKGYEAGYNEARSATAHQMTQRLSQLDSMIQLMDAPMKDLDDALVDEMASLSIAIANQLIRRELKIDPSQVIAVVRDTVKLLPVTARNIRLHMNPSDAVLVKELLEVDGNDLVWKIEEDPVVTQGGLLVTTDNSSIDATVESRIASVAATLLGGQRSDDVEDSNSSESP